MTDIIVNLGGVAFGDMETPDEIPFGGDQALKVHKLVGGNRVIDSMGRDDIPLQWSGTFFGANALPRAQAIDAMRIAGKPVKLTWSALAYTVLIKRFVPKFRFISYIPYEIVCEIITDDANPDTGSDTPSLDDQMSNDSNDVSDAGDGVPFF